MKKKSNVEYEGSLLTEHDIYLFKEGSHFTLFEKMGAHLSRYGAQPGRISPYGHQMPKRSRSLVTSTAGTRHLIP